MTLWQSFTHAIQWRVISLMIDFVIIYSVSGQIKLSLAISSLSALARTVAHTIWVWAKLRGTKGDFYSFKS